MSLVPPSLSYRSFDVGLDSTPVDSSMFAGDWINTSNLPQGWHSLHTSFIDGVPKVHARLADGTIVEFSRIELYGGVGSSDLAAFSGAVSEGETRILLQGNLNLGLFVVATFKFPAAGGTGYFSREFFARSALEAPVAHAASGDPGALFGKFAEPHSLDLDALQGCWRNAELEPGGLLKINIEAVGDGLAARAWGTPVSVDGNVIDWGSTGLKLFGCLDEAGNPSLVALADWDFEIFRTSLQLRIPGGALAIAGFNKFRDGRMNYATREFFYRLPD